MSKPPRTLAAFVHAKRRSGCPVCALPAGVRQQLTEARNRKITRAVQLEWLRTEVGVKVTDADLTAHVNGRHDVEDT